MAKVSKSTKKFQSKHLKNAIDQRRKLKESRKRIQGRRGNKTDAEKQEKAGTKEEQRFKRAHKEQIFKDLAVDEFFDKELELPKANKKLHAEDINSSSEDDEEIDEETQKYLDDDMDDDISDNDNVEEASEEDEVEKTEVTLKQLKLWNKKLKTSGNSEVVENVILGFQAAIIDDTNALKNNKYVVNSSEVAEALIMIVFSDLIIAIKQLVKYKEKKGARVLPQHEDANCIAKAVPHLIVSLSLLLQKAEDIDTIDTILSTVSEVLPFIVPDAKILKKLLKLMCELWSQTNDDHIRSIIINYLIKFGREYKSESLKTVLKHVYTNFVKEAFDTDEDTIYSKISQKLSARELFIIDEAISYQVGFEFIKQLALHLKSTMKLSSDKETLLKDKLRAYKNIYNWQFCQSLDFWLNVIGISYVIDPTKKDSPLKQLTVHLIQIALNVIRLIPTAQFYPLRFYMFRSLLKFVNQTNVFIPLYPILNEVIFSDTFTKNAKNSDDLNSINLSCLIKCPEQYLGTKTYQNAVWNECIQLLLHYLNTYCKHVAFPELVTPILIELNRFNRTVTIDKFNNTLTKFISKIRDQSEFIQIKRANLEYSPSNDRMVKSFLNDVSPKKTPLGSFLASQITEPLFELDLEEAEF